MSLELAVTADVYANAERGWLLVEGEHAPCPVPDVDYPIRHDEWCQVCDGYVNLHNAVLGSPAALSALVGKACEGGMVVFPGNERYHDEQCDCLGSGAALVTVTTECETCGGKGRIVQRYLNWGDQPCQRCDQPTEAHKWPSGTRSLRVKLTDEALPIVDEWDRYDQLHESGECISVGGSHPWLINIVSKGDRLLTPIREVDLGPNPAQYIGWFAFPCEAVR